MAAIDGRAALAAWRQWLVATQRLALEAVAGKLLPEVVAWAQQA